LQGSEGPCVSRGFGARAGVIISCGVFWL